MEKKLAMKVGGIVLVCLLVVFGLLYAFGYFNGHVVGPNDGVNTAAVNLGLPNDYPYDIPIYPGATKDSYLPGSDTGLDIKGSAVTIVTDDDPGKVYSYYGKQLRKNGWKLDVTGNDQLRLVNFMKKDRMGMVMIQVNGTGSVITISVIG